MPDADRLNALRRFLEDLAPLLEMDLAVRLWDGSAVPLGAAWSGDLAIAVRDPVAVTRLLRRPRLFTLVDLLGDGLLDIEGGTLLDLAARRGTRGTRGLWKRVDKLAALRALGPFLFGPGAVKAGHAYAGAQWRRRGAARTTSAVPFHYDLSNEFYALFLDRRWCIPALTSADWEADIRRGAARGQAGDDLPQAALAPGGALLDIKALRPGRAWCATRRCITHGCGAWGDAQPGAARLRVAKVSGWGWRGG
jgi:cyclopropane-fatty-acyl-phospholipid synthase